MESHSQSIFLLIRGVSKYVINSIKNKTNREFTHMQARRRARCRRARPSSGAGGARGVRDLHKHQNAVGPRDAGSLEHRRRHTPRPPAEGTLGLSEMAPRPGGGRGDRPPARTTRIVGADRRRSPARSLGRTRGAFPRSRRRDGGGRGSVRRRGRRRTR